VLQNAQFLNVTADGTYNYHQTLNDKGI